MKRMLNAYQYRGNTVVLDKSHVMNAKDIEFEPVALILSYDEVKQIHEENERAKALEADKGNGE